MEESCKGRSPSPDRVADAKRERESHLGVLAAQKSFLVKAEREKALEELELVKERAMKAESRRGKALLA